MAQHKATLRKSLRSALKHKRLADQILDLILDGQTKFNLVCDKLDADTAIALDADYVDAARSIDEFDFDAEGTDAQHKATLRKTLRSALSHKALADELADAIEEYQVAHNALLAKLDADAGTLTVGNVTAFGLTAVDSDAEGSDAQHKATFRKSMRSAMSHVRLADQILDAVSGLQEAFNGLLAQLDTLTINGACAAFKVTPIDPDSE